jgi:hypothetical protein
MIRRRLLLVERSLHGGAAELQETELPSLALLPFVAATSTAAAAQDEHGGRASGSTGHTGGGGGGIPRSYSAAAAAAASGREDWDTPVSSTAWTQRRPPRASSTSNLFPLPSAAAAGAGGAGGGGGIGEDGAGVAAARVAERIWEVVDEGNRVVLIGRLFELSDHPDCFRGVTDAKLVRTTDCTALALCLPVGLMCRCVPCVWCGWELLSPHSASPLFPHTPDGGTQWRLINILCLV